MEDKLRGYIPYKDKDYKKIWKNAYIVVDTNVILNFYRYSDTTREELWKILEILKERLWMPYQVGFEYCKNRENVIDKVQKSFTKIEEEFSKQTETLKNKLQAVDKKDIKCKDTIIGIMNKATEKVIKMIEDERKQQHNFEKEDSVLDKVSELFKGKCSENESEEKLKEIKLEANRRGENKIPPGYLDYKKEENHGDYYIFYSLIQKAKKDKKDIIFITDDDKEDWYLKKEGKIKSGRPELLQEFYIKTQQLIFICTTDTFLKSYNEYCSGSASEEIIEEIEDIRRKEQLEFKNQELRRLNFKTTINRDKSREFLHNINIMKRYLSKMISYPEENEMLLHKIEFIAQNIIEDIRYEKYHGKILMVIDKLERNIKNEENIYECMLILNKISNEINN